MHELSIAHAVLEVALASAGGRRVRRVELRVGHLRQVVRPALEFAFELVSRGTAAEGAALAVESVAVEVRCRACGAESAPPGFPLLCAGCGRPDVDVIAGEELSVEWLELEEPEGTEGTDEPEALTSPG